MSCLDHVSNRGIRVRLLRGEMPEWLAKTPRRKYIAQIILSMPPWVTRRELMEVNRRMRERTEATGVQHSIGHVVPLNHPLVCGLTVPWNLRVEPLKANCARGNAWHQDQQDLFELGVGEQGMLI